MRCYVISSSTNTISLGMERTICLSGLSVSPTSSCLRQPFRNLSKSLRRQQFSQWSHCHSFGLFDRPPRSKFPHTGQTLPRISQTCRTYFSPNSPPQQPYEPAQSAILSAAIERVPTHGFTDGALTLGATDAGYLPASVNLFQRGAFELVLYHLIVQRLALKDTVQFPEPDVHQGKDPNFKPPLSQASKIRSLILARLQANAPIIHQLPSALALMAMPSNMPASLEELARLSDEIWYLSGDVSVDSSWYTKRAAVAGVYASSELFMTQDKSNGFKDTEEFVDRRLEEMTEMGTAAADIREWVEFTALSTVNVLRSWGMRI